MDKPEKPSVSGTKRNTTCLLCDRQIDMPELDGKWCSDCDNKITQFIISSFHQAGKLEEAEKTLSSLMGHHQTPAVRYYLGLVKAQAGNLEESIGLLKSLTDTLKENVEFGKAFSHILASHASQQIKLKNYHGAAQDLELASEIIPDDALIERSLNLAKMADIISQTGKSKDGEALENLIKLYQQIQKDQPDNVIIGHNMAVLSYRLASESEEEKKDKIADTAWRNTIANWSLLLNSESFWRQWAEKENSSYKLATRAEDIKALRAHIRERLLQDFRLYRTRYGEVSDTKAALRHREYEVLLLLEAKTASAMRKVIELFRQHDIKPPLTVCCGPLMLDDLNIASLAKDIISQARDHRFPEKTVNDLEHCISPSGRIDVLIETNWLEQAETELDDLLDKFPSHTAYLTQMVNVLTQLARQLASTENLNDAVKKLEKGIHLAKDDKGLRELAATIFLDEAKRITESGKPADVIGKVIKLLEKGRTLSKNNHTLVEELATRYAERAILKGNRDDWEGARNDIHHALTLDENNGLALQSEELTYNNLAVKLANNGQVNEAIEVVKEGLHHKSSNLLNDLLAQLKRVRGW